MKKEDLKEIGTIMTVGAASLIWVFEIMEISAKNNWQLFGTLAIILAPALPIGLGILICSFFKHD